MAIIISPVWSAISGKIGGTVYLRNKYHSIIGRERVTPVNPNTPLQNIVRAIMNVAHSRWLSFLTPDERIAWEQYAATITFQGPLGGTYNPTGQNLFIGCYTCGMRFAVPLGFNVGDADNSALPGDEMFSDPIPDSQPLTPAGIGVDVFSTNFDIRDGFLICQASPVVPPTINFYNGPWLPLQTVVSTTTAPNVKAVCSMIMGGNIGDIRFFRMKFYFDAAEDPIKPRYSRWVQEKLVMAETTIP